MVGVGPSLQYESKLEAWALTLSQAEKAVKATVTRELRAVFMVGES